MKTNYNLAVIGGILICLWSSFFSPTQVQAKGIQFMQGSWNDIITVAHEEQKLIFVGVFADHCISCQEMAQYIFTDNEIGDLYNSYFVNYSVNVDAVEGDFFKKKYKLKPIPYLLFFDEQGELVLRIPGHKTKPQLLNVAQQVLTMKHPRPEAGTELPSGKLKNALIPSLDRMHHQYETGFDMPAFLYDYAYRLKEQGIAAPDVVNKYIAKQNLKNKLQTEADVQFVYDFAEDFHNNAFEVLLTHQNIFEKAYGSQHIATKIRNFFKKNMDTAVSKKDEELYKKIKKILKKWDLPVSETSGKNLLSPQNKQPINCPNLLFRAKNEKKQSTKKTLKA